MLTHAQRHLSDKTAVAKCEFLDGGWVTPNRDWERRLHCPVGARADTPWFDPQRHRSIYSHRVVFGLSRAVRTLLDRAVKLARPSYDIESDAAEHVRVDSRGRGSPTRRLKCTLSTTTYGKILIDVGSTGPAIRSPEHC